MDETLLMIPGPTRVAPRVLKAMSENIVNHRSAVFGEIITETTEMMSEVFQTENQSYIINRFWNCRHGSGPGQHSK